MSSERLRKLFIEVELLRGATDQSAPIDWREKAAEKLLMNAPTRDALCALAHRGPEKYRGEAKSRLDKIEEETEWVMRTAEIEDEAGGFPGVIGGAGHRKKE